MSKRPQRSREGSLAELQAWYLESLGPKLARAATTGKVEPVAALAVDRELRRFFEFPADDRREAA